MRDYRKTSLIDTVVEVLRVHEMTAVYELQTPRPLFAQRLDEEDPSFLPVVYELVHDSAYWCRVGGARQGVAVEDDVVEVAG